MIENIKKVIVAIPLISLAIIPPIEINILTMINSKFWFWSILLAGLLGLLFLYTKADSILKILVVYLFISCFRSRAPYLSFTSYLLFIAVAYYYLLCISLKDFEFIKKIVQAVFFLNIILIVNQQFGGDKLLNFGRSIPVCFGTIGNPMWLGSLLICLTPFLMLHSKLNIFPLTLAVWLSRSRGAVIALLLGAFVYLKGWKKLFIVVAVIFILFMAKGQIIAHYQGGRWPVWKRTIKTSLQYPFFGWGIGTYKVIFPALNKDVAGGLAGESGNWWNYEGTDGNWLAWRQAHNCWLQIPWEIGYIGLGLFLAFLIGILYKLSKLPKTQEIAMVFSGISTISFDMFIHYPTRLIQSVLFLIVFLAYCKTLTLKGGSHE